jgi:hypothetical protein
MSASFVQQQMLFDEITPAQRWDEEATKRSLDDLFNFARHYRSSDSYRALIDFVARFRFYAPYNAMLVHIQMSGARFVATAHRWVKRYGRSVKPNARPLVILQPMGPVMFVFDVSDTEPGPDSRPLPQEVEKPFYVRQGSVGSELEHTVENAKRDGIRISFQKEGSQSAGSIRVVDGRGKPPLLFPSGKDKEGNQTNVAVPVRYELLINENLNIGARYATIAHELAHMYCGHIGTANPKWWPDRRGLAHEVREFEAESVAYLICERLGIKNPSVEYLAGYMGKNQEVPGISLECVIKVAGLIEQMGRQRLKPRKEK